MIELLGITKSYLMGGSKLTVLRDIDLAIEDGEFVSIMGPSGSGKSTLMNILGCFDTPTQGEYRLRGRPVQSLDSDALAHIRNREIGFVFQNFHLLPRMTALKNVELPMVYKGLSRRQRSDRAVELLQRVGLSDRADHLPQALSGGQKQRVAIARALANEPTILLADEPTGALDSVTGKEILGIFSALNQTGVTVVVITHDESVASYANRVIRLKDGRVIADERGASHDSF